MVHTGEAEEQIGGAGPGAVEQDRELLQPETAEGAG